MAGLTNAEVRKAVRAEADSLLKRAVYLSDDTVATVMDWYTAHRYHKPEPYIGCPFCQDQFIRREPADALAAALSWAQNFISADHTCDPVDIHGYDDLDPECPGCVSVVLAAAIDSYQTAIA